MKGAAWGQITEGNEDAADTRTYRGEGARLFLHDWLLTAGKELKCESVTEEGGQLRQDRG